MLTRTLTPSSRLRTRLRASIVAALLGSATLTAAEAADWKALSPAETARTEGSLIVHDGGVYHFNGFDRQIDIEPSVERYDLATGRWRTVASSEPSGSSPSAVTHAGVVKVDDTLWFIGGRIGDSPGRISNRIAIFDLDEHTWSDGPVLPRPFAAGGAALIGTRVHVFGGLDPFARCDVDTHWVYDLAGTAKGWQDLRGSSAFPMPRNHFATVVLDDIIYAIGGQRGHDGACAQLTNQREQTRWVHAYDAASDRWRRLSDLPWAQSHAEASSFAHAGKLWSVGGIVNGKRVLSYEPAADRWNWERALELPEALLAPGARIIDGSLMLFGGGAPNVLNPRRNTWKLTAPGLAVVDSPAVTPEETPEDPPEEVPGVPTAAADAAYRINIGGPPLIDGLGHRWEADQSSSARYGAGSSKRWNAGAVARTDAAPGSAPPALFADQRWSADSSQGLAWRFPVAPGAYEVRLHVAEMWSRAFEPGVRRFDVAIEGQVRATNVDVFARFGARTGGVLSWRVDSDAELDIALRHRDQNPAVQGIEIIALDDDDRPTAPTTPDDAVEPARLLIDTLDVEFGPVALGQRAEREILLSNTGGTTLTIDRVSSNRSSDVFSFSLPDGSRIAPGAKRRERIVFVPQNAGDITALITLLHDGVDDAELLSVSGTGVAQPLNEGTDPQDDDPSQGLPLQDDSSTPVTDGLADGTLTSVWRINIGGDAILGSDGLLWQADKSDTADGYRHDGSRRYATQRGIRVSDEVPAATTAALFQTERWGNDTANGLVWGFPVTPGRYEVHLYFAEIYSAAFGADRRTFDVDLEGKRVLEAMDAYEQAGADTGIVKRFVVDSDSTLDVVMRHRKQNPALKAIEILACHTECS